MEVILLERVGKLGKMGDVVRVKDGYARNFLLPRGKALRANAESKAKYEGMKAELQKQSLERKGEAGKVAAKVDGKTFIVIRSASETGQLFGSVSTRDIATLISSEGNDHQPHRSRTQRADQVDRPVQGAAGAASGRRSLGHHHRRPQRGGSRTYRPRRGRYRPP